MARIRSIKPDFFLHEGLAELTPLHRLFFVGLWTLADRFGRLEDRPKRIKAALMPWEDCDVDALLADLDAGDFIHRYEAEGKACIAIPGFEKHQRAHPKESSFDLPMPPSREKVGTSREKNRLAGKRFSSIPSATAGKEILESGKEILEVEMERKAPPPQVPLLEEAFVVVPKERRKPEKPKPEQLQALWNQFKAPEMPRWEEMPEERARSARKRMEERSLEEWAAIIQRLALSDFARGRTHAKDGRPWVADPEFLLRPGSATKTLEGKYDNRGVKPPPTPAGRACKGCGYVGTVVGEGDELYCYENGCIGKRMAGALRAQEQQSARRASA